MSTSPFMTTYSLSFRNSSLALTELCMNEMSGVFTESYRLSMPRWSSTLVMPGSSIEMVRFFSSTS